MRALFLVFFGVLAAPLLAQPVATDSTDTAVAPPRNLIVLIPDGFGPASQTMAREYLREVEGRELVLDRILTGAVRTYASDSRVTDSAASATAYASGVKTYNGAIGVDTSGASVATLLEAAEAQGKATGLVATSRITHATPAAFASHVSRRWMEDEIAAQMLTQGIEVILGGGRRHFRPDSLDGKATGGVRTDARDLLAEAAARGYIVATDRTDFDGMRTDAVAGADTAPPLLGVFADGHLAYDIDRDPATQPSLAEMTALALDHVGDDPDGFFLMVEGSRIDHAGHGNDPVGHLYDILAFDAAVELALAYAEADGQTLVVVMADHETGGLSLGRDIDGRGVYDWRPDVLARARHSAEGMVRAAQAGASIDTLLAESGITDLTDAERVALTEVNDAPYGPGSLASVLSDIVSRRALVGWTTGGHTAVAVNLHSYGPGAARFSGVMDNAAIGRALADVMQFDLAALTAELRREPMPAVETLEEESP